jgi:hypothetical protein
MTLSRMHKTVMRKTFLENKFCAYHGCVRRISEWFLMKKPQLRRARKEDLLASHNPHDTTELCDTIYEIDGGSITKLI